MRPVINKAEVSKVYSGRPGCACGCRGNYSEHAAQITRVLNLYASLPAETEVGVEYTKAGAVEFVYWNSENGNRTYTIYTIAHGAV